MTEPTWVIMPVLASPAYTEAAISDVLAQSVPTRLLLLNQGVDDAFRQRLERIAEQADDRVFCWHHQPSLPSLAASWNRALDFVWACGGREALVVNNDVRLHRGTVAGLLEVLRGVEALFVSAVGVTAEQFAAIDGRDLQINAGARGGPDFSCFLISKECHDRYRFDEGCVPAYLEDLSYHRDLLLAGEGHRIFSINLPYLHYASGTLKAVDPKERQRIETSIAQGSRSYYRRVWGGDANQETFMRKGDPSSAVTGGMATTPYLQAHPPAPRPEV